MDSYFTLKLIHVLSATILTGTGIGIAFFMFMANLSSNVQAIAVTARHVVLADWLFTAPAVVIQFISGIMLMEILGFTYTSIWFQVVIGLFLLIGACWLPVIYIQYKIRELAFQALETNEIDPKFKKLMMIWTSLGIPAFISIIIIYWIMIFKPLPISS